MVIRNQCPTTPSRHDPESPLLPRADGVLLDHPLLLGREVHALVIDVLIFGRYAQDLESFF